MRSVVCPLRTQPSGQLKVYQLPIIQYHKFTIIVIFFFKKIYYTGRVGRPWHCHFLHTVNLHCQLPSKASAELVRGHPALHRAPWHIHLSIARLNSLVHWTTVSVLLGSHLL